jgi:hypothetical protein
MTNLELAFIIVVPVLFNAVLTAVLMLVLDHV